MKRLYKVNQANQKAMETLDTVASVVGSYRDRMVQPRVYFDDDISPKKLTNARNKYARLDESERSLVLLDTTGFGSAKTGAILTETHLHVKDISKKPRRISWSEIESATFVGQRETGDLHINGEQFLQLTNLQQSSMRLLVRMIQDILVLFHPETTETTEHTPEIPEDIFKKLDVLQNQDTEWLLSLYCKGELATMEAVLVREELGCRALPDEMLRQLDEAGERFYGRRPATTESASPQENLSDEVGRVQDRTVASIVGSYRDLMDDPRVSFDDDISPKKLTNACNKYARLDESERSLVLLDNTVFGSAKTGVILTETHLHVKDFAVGPRISWSEIESATFTDRVKGGTGAHLQINVNGEQIFLLTFLKQSSRRLFVRMIQDILALFHPETTEAARAYTQNARRHYLNKRARWRITSVIGACILGVIVLIGIFNDTPNEPWEDAEPNTTYAANEDLRFINTNKIDQISNARLFFVTSTYGFIYDLETGSPIQDEIPAEVGVPKHERLSRSMATVLEQTIETSEQDFQTLEGGLPGGVLAWFIIGGVLGAIFALRFRLPVLGGVLVGAIGVYVIALFTFTPGAFVLYVDNATDQDILLVVDSFSPIALSSRSQVGVKFKEGTHRIKTIKASDNSDLEHFNLQATKYQDENGDTISGYYIYNVAAKNKYIVHHVFYGPE